MELLTEENLAEQLHLSRLTLKQWRCEGRGPKFIKLPGRKPGAGTIRYKQEDVDFWLGPSVGPDDRTSTRVRRAKHEAARRTKRGSR